MSKMYEALKKAQQSGVKVDLPVPIVVPETAGYLPREARAASVEDPVEPVPDYGIRQVPIELGDGPILPWSSSDQRGGEEYRIIRTRIVQHPLSPKIIVVSSAGSGDGKTVTAINVAGALSLRDSANVLLIDGDFRRPNIAPVLGLANTPGLANSLSGQCPLQEAMIRVEQFPNLYVLPAGVARRNPTELLDSEPWRELCAAVREQFDFVIIDAPPIAAVADYELIQTSCDGVIVVVRPDHTDRTLCKRVLEMIPEEKRLGVVLNCAYDWFLWRTHESYYYGSGAPA